MRKTASGHNESAVAGNIWGVLRIHFSRDDLARTKFAGGPDWFWELSLSMHHLHTSEVPLHLADWKRTLVRQLHPAGPLRPAVDVALALSPPQGYFPDFLTPADGVTNFDTALESILSTPKERLAKEIGLMHAPSGTRRTTVAAVGRGEPEAMRALGGELGVYRDVALTPIWKRVTSAVDHDRGNRTRQLATGGWGKVFNQLHPEASFADGVLNIGVWGHAADRDLVLDGRGLLLIPSYFKNQRQLMVLADADLPPVLVYPVDTSSRLTADLAHSPLAALIGATRAQVLALANDRNTSEIARLQRVSVPAASKHLAVLRDTGLVSSTRHRGMVIHKRTELGTSLLEGSL